MPSYVQGYDSRETTKLKGSRQESDVDVSEIVLQVLLPYPEAWAALIAEMAKRRGVRDDGSG